MWNKDFIILLLINSATGISFQILAPNLPVYAQHQLGFSESMIGFLAASLAFGALLSRPFAGPLVDTLNRKKINIFSLLMMSAAVLSLNWASSPAVLIGIRFLHGVLFGINSTVSTTMASMATPEGKMGQGIGIYSITGIGAQAIAPALGITIAARWGYPTLFICAACISALVSPLPLALSERVVLRKEKTADSAKKGFSVKKLPTPNILAFALLAVFYTGVTSSVTNFMVLYGMGKGISNVGFYFTLFALVIIAIRLTSGSLTDRHPFQRILYPCSACCALALLTISWADSFMILAVAAVFMGVGYGMAFPTVQAVSIRAAEPENRGQAVAIVYSGSDLAHCFGPIVMGFLVEALGYSQGFRVMCFAMLATVPVIFFLSSGKRAR